MLIIGKAVCLYYMSCEFSTAPTLLYNSRFQKMLLIAINFNNTTWSIHIVVLATPKGTDKTQILYMYHHSGKVDHRKLHYVVV